LETILYDLIPHINEDDQIIDNIHHLKRTALSSPSNQQKGNQFFEKMSST